jgi:hypothetical protein
MRKTIFVFCLLLSGWAFVSPALAQDEPQPPEAAKASEAPAHYYHLEFVVQELGNDGKPANSRTYTTTVSTDNRGGTSIRTSSRIPFPISSSGSDNNVTTNFQYQDVGVRIDAQRAHEVGRQLSLDLTADITSATGNTDAKLHQPVMRQNKWQAVVLVPVGKSTVVFTSDTLDSKGSMQLVVTATPVP